MARIQDRQKAIELRLLGKTYSEIRRELSLPKSTLSDWLTKYPLSENQLKLLQKSIKKNKELAIEKYRNTMRLKREKRLRETYIVQSKELLPLTKRELEIAGYFLYWGEGQKRFNGPVGINNTDPKVVKFALYWFTQILMIPNSKIRVLLHLYKDMNIKEEMNYWSKEIKIPLSQFYKPYIKESNKSSLTHKGFGHGTCALVVGNILLKEKILMSIEAIADLYCSKI